MIGDYETAKLAALSVLFVVLVVAAIVIGVRDAGRQRIEHERRVRQQVALLKRARADAERKHQQEMQTGNDGFETASFRPSEFGGTDSSSHIPDQSRGGAGRPRGGSTGTFDAA